MAKPSILLTQLPWNVQKRITSSTDLKTRMSLRKCSKEFRRIVKYLPTIYYKLQFETHPHAIHFIFTDDNEKHNFWYFKDVHKKLQKITYHYHPEGCVIRDGEWERLIEGANYMEMAVRDFETFVRKANVKVNKLTLSLRPQNYYAFFQLTNDFGFYDSMELMMKEDASLLLEFLCRSLKRIKGKLSTRYFKTKLSCEQEELLQVLQSLRPGTLETIRILGFQQGQEIGKILDMEQWKKAKEVGITGSDVTAAALLSFSKSTTEDVTFSTEDMISLVNAALKHGESFQKADLLCFGHNFDDFRKYLLRFPCVPGEHNAWKVQIPASKWYLKVRVYRMSIKITAVDPSVQNES